jgi:diguanylate cyclase (GGDEF)-like protein
VIPGAASSRRLHAVVVPVLVAGIAAYAAALISFASSGRRPGEVIGVLVLLGATAIAEHYPVPVEGVDATGVSLGFVFGVAAIVLYGWDAGVLVFATPQAVNQLFERRAPIRIAFNAGVFALAAALSGVTVAWIDGAGAAETALLVALVSLVQYSVNLVLVSAVIAASSRRRYLPLIRSNVAWTALPFSLMASAALILVVLWQRTPFLAAALGGPLIAISLYQRSTHEVLRAMRLALTDTLTGLGNHRHFHERLEQELRIALETGSDMTLCYVDVDDFKHINDTYGHPAGDRVLSEVASRLRQDGEAFRLGGDEFALVLPACSEDQAVVAAEAIVRRMAALDLEHIGRITVSAGVASFPQQAGGLDELIRVTDGALYAAKEHGKNRVGLARTTLPETAELRRLADDRDVAARHRAGISLAQAVDRRDSFDDGHSERVADLAAGIAARIGLSDDEIELARLAGSLHDLGKLAVPEQILRKPGPLDAREREAVERHPQIGYRMLERLGVEAVALWVLHHHERWDGTGYPKGLSGEDIPLGARIVFVADAYDAMVSGRAYAPPLSPSDALAEFERCAGSQFDPHVVTALAEHLGLGVAALAS